MTSLRMPARTLAALLLATLLAGLDAPSRWAAAQTAPLELRTTAISLHADKPDIQRVGPLLWRGGLRLDSPNRAFGGLSDMLLSADGRMLWAVGDEGAWLAARLDYSDGRLSGVTPIGWSSLVGPDGRRPERKAARDAESLVRLADDRLLIGFEHEHRIWQYAAPTNETPGRPRIFPSPPGLAAAPDNTGLEAMIALRDGRLLALSENLAAGPHIRGWIWDGTAWSKLAFERAGDFRPTGAALLPEGDVIVLERSFSPLAGLAIRLRRIATESIESGALLRGEELAEMRPPYQIDNFEGIAARRGARGETLIYLLSDDNFNILQRTLLVMFELEGPPPAID